MEADRRLGMCRRQSASDHGSRSCNEVDGTRHRYAFARAQAGAFILSQPSAQSREASTVAERKTDERCTPPRVPGAQAWNPIPRLLTSTDGPDRATSSLARIRFANQGLKCHYN